MIPLIPQDGPTPCEKDRKINVQKITSSSLWKRITEIAETLSEEPGKKRTVAEQMHHPNLPVEEIEVHYRVRYFNGFLDLVRNQLKTTFPQELEGAALATYLLPNNINLPPVKLW